MGKEYSAFRFKQFSVEQNIAAMKIGTDGVLLGAWTPLYGGERHILDVGTGTGVIALMIAQRTAHRMSAPMIDAVEIDLEAADEARSNAERSPWAERLAVYGDSFQNFCHRRNRPLYDLIVSNPPYFIADSHRGGKHAIKSPERLAARHACRLAYGDLIDGARGLLDPAEGCLCVILPYLESALFASLAGDGGLQLSRSLLVRPTPDKEVKRVAMEFSVEFNPCPRLAHIDELCIALSEGVYSDEYRSLTRDFYLDF